MVFMELHKVYDALYRSRCLPVWDLESSGSYGHTGVG